MHPSNQGNLSLSAVQKKLKTAIIHAKNIIHITICNGNDKTPSQMARRGFIVLYLD